MFIRISIFSLLLVVLTGCAASQNQAVMQFDQAYFNDRVAQIRSAAQQADVIVVATVTQVGAAPGRSSGFVKVNQHVSYRIDKLLKGYYQQSAIDVEHVLVANSRHVKLAAQGLDPAIFTPGNKLILLLKNVNTLFYEDVNEHVGSIDYSANNERALLHAL
ncbi:MAG: hypothetical protein R3241_04220 [Rheinheimera sp.]|nr:hypothetical protein [Rheinheimera sp.]